MVWRSRLAQDRLIVHVGRHKTGSTSLQLALSCLHLERFGILYPKMSRLDGQHSELAALGLTQSLCPQQLQQQLSALTDEIQAVRPVLTVLSSEVFSEVAKRHPQNCHLLLRHLAERWHLELLQVVRPLPAYFLSALKHQLRAGTFLQRSPLTWYRHCLEKTRILDAFWSHAGYRITTLPYNAADSVGPVVAFLAERAELSPRLSRRLLASLPDTWANSRGYPDALYITYFIYLIAVKAGALSGGQTDQPLSLFLCTFDVFARILQDDPDWIAELEQCGLDDAALLAFCQSQTPAELPLHPSINQAHLDWQQMLDSNLYARCPPRFLDRLKVIHLGLTDAGLLRISRDSP